MIVLLFGISYSNPINREQYPGFTFDKSQIDLDIQNILSNITNDVEDSQSTLFNSNSIAILQAKLTQYKSTFQVHDTQQQIDILKSMVTEFKSLIDSKVFVHGNYFQKHSPDSYLLQANGTNLCFGPRKDKKVFRTVKQDATYHLYDCTNFQYIPLLEMQSIDGKYSFINDLFTQGQYCAFWRDAHKWDKGLLYKFQAPCPEKIEDPWSGVKAIEQGHKVILYGINANKDDGKGFVACGAQNMNCPGMANDQKCWWAQNKGNPITDTQLFESNHDQCFTSFNKIPIYYKLSPSKVRKNLMITPYLANIHLLTIAQLFALDTDQNHIIEFNIAHQNWTDSYNALVHYYRVLPQQNDDLSWIPKYDQQMKSLCLNVSKCDGVTLPTSPPKLPYAYEQVPH